MVSIDALPVRARGVAPERRDLRDRTILLDANDQVVVWYPPDANEQVRARYSEMKAAKSMAEIRAVMLNWGVVTIEGP